MNVKWLFDSCRRCAADLSLLAAGVLGSEARARTHLETCPACQARFGEFKRLTAALDRAGKNLPHLDPPASLRRRWTAAVREPARAEAQLPGWLGGRKLAWSGIAALWALILFFRFSGPEAPKPVVRAAMPASLRDVILALKVEAREQPHQAGKRQDKNSAPALPPHSRRPGARLHFEAA